MKQVVGFYGQSNKWTHDHSVTFSTEGKITDYLHLERMTRKKYDNRIPDNLLKIINSYGYDHYELDFTSVNTFSLGNDFFKKADSSIVSSDRSLNIDTEPISDLKHRFVKADIFGSKKEILVVPHELAHIFTCVPFYGFFKNNSLLIHIDGAASISNASAWHYLNGDLKLIGYSSKFHDALLNFSTNNLTLKILGIPYENYKSAPGKLMGLSSFGNINMDLYQNLVANKFLYNYENSEEINQFIKNNNYRTSKIKLKDQFSYDFAASVQKYFEDKIISFIEENQLITGAKYLYYSGGAALNIKLNSKLAKFEKFKEIYIPPAPGDSGLSIGAVSYYNWINNINTSEFSVFGNNYNLNEWKFDPNYSIDEICKHIFNGKVIGIAVGKAEIGPRALGHRSIIAIPRKEMFRKVSMEIKNREWYRPLAPVILESLMDEMFDNIIKTPYMYYMLQEFDVKKEMRDKYPAIVHVDGTSRPQIVKDDNKELILISNILKTMYNNYNIHCLINTSFNVAGEPIVHSKQDAIDSGKSMGLDGIIFNNEFINFKEMR